MSSENRFGIMLDGSMKHGPARLTHDILRTRCGMLALILETITSRVDMPAKTHQFPCLSDNFGVLIHDPATGATASIDAPEAAPIEAALQETGPVTPAELFSLAAKRVAEEADTAPLVLQIWAGAAADDELRALLRHRAGGLPVGVAAHVEEWCVAHGYGDERVAVASLLVGLVMGLVIQSSLFDDFVTEGYVSIAVEALSRLGQA